MRRHRRILQRGPDGDTGAVRCADLLRGGVPRADTVSYPADSHSFGRKLYKIILQRDTAVHYD